MLHGGLGLGFESAPAPSLAFARLVSDLILDFRQWWGFQVRHGRANNRASHARRNYNVLDINYHFTKLGPKTDWLGRADSLARVHHANETEGKILVSPLHPYPCALGWVVTLAPSSQEAPAGQHVVLKISRAVRSRDNYTINQFQHMMMDLTVELFNSNTFGHRVLLLNPTSCPNADGNVGVR